jgi:hypothetical protein
MGIFGSGHKKSGLTAIFDIESGSVGVALVRTVPAQGNNPAGFAPGSGARAKPTVVWSAREEFLFQENISWKRLLNSMYKALELACEDMRATGLADAAKMLKLSRTPLPDKIVCIFSSPWYSSTTKLLHTEKDKPFLVNEAFFRQIQKDTAARISKTEAVAGQAKDYEILEQAIINIQLNGYEVTKPLGKMANKVDLAVFVAEMHADVADRVVERVGQFFPDVSISVHSCALALYTILRNLFPAQQCGLMVHVTGEITDLSLFKDGVLLETVSFPFGSHSIIRMAAIATATAPAELRSILKLAGSVEGSGSQRAKAERALEKAHMAWSKHWREAVAHLGDEIGFLPRQVFVFSQGEFADAYTRWINQEVFGLVNSSGPFRTTSVLSPFIRDYVGGSRDVERDLLLDVESLYLQEQLSTTAWL